MSQLETLLISVSEPTPHSLWRLRNELLRDGLLADSTALIVLSHAFDFLNDLESRLTAQGFTELASTLNIGEGGTAALQALTAGDMDAPDFWRQFLLGALGEGLNVLASRQYIKGAKADVKALLQSHAWILYDALWQLSVAQQPDLDENGRSQTLSQLFDPIWDDETEPMAKAALLGRLYQILLLVYLSQESLETGD